MGPAPGQTTHTRGGLMGSGSGVPHGRAAGRLMAFYAIIAAVTIAVVVIVIDQGKGEKAQPVIAGGYDAQGTAACIGPNPAPPGGPPLPSTAPAQAKPGGPSFNLVQSGQFLNITNNAEHARRPAPAAPRVRHRRASPDRDRRLRVRQEPATRRDGGGRPEDGDHRLARRRAVRGRPQARSARSGLAAAADSERDLRQVRRLPALDLLWRLVHAERQRLAATAFRPAARSSGRSATRRRPAPSAATSPACAAATCA